jgi:hypothetical protein
MPLLLPVALLVALFVLALLVWPLTLWRRARRGHLRRRIAPWAIHVRGALLLGATLLFALFAAAGWTGASPRDAFLGLGAGLGIGTLAGLLARIERDGRALHLTPRAGFAIAIALVVAGRVAWLGWDLATGGGWADARRHAAPLGGFLLGYALAQAAALSVRLRRVARARLA